MAPAEDRFDSDCVVGTQFESSQPHHAVLRKRGRRSISRLFFSQLQNLAFCFDLQTLSESFYDRRRDPSLS